MNSLFAIAVFPQATLVGLTLLQNMVHIFWYSSKLLQCLQYYAESR